MYAFLPEVISSMVGAA